MQDRPTARELLETVAELLEKQVLPATSGGLQHQVRVAENLCRIAARDVELGPAHERAERERLQALLASDCADLAELNARLVARLAAGPDPAFEKRAWAATLASVREKLATNKPGYDDYDYADEVPV